jgi:hypothetical protein
MSAYNFSVEYKPGSSHNVPDELSRMMKTGHSELPSSEEDDSFVPCLVIDTVAEDGLLPTPVYPRASPLIQVPEPLEAISVEDLLAAQAEYPWFDDLIEHLLHGVKPTKPPGFVFTSTVPSLVLPWTRTCPYDGLSPHPLDRSRVRWPITPELPDIPGQQSSRLPLVVIGSGHRWPEIVLLRCAVARHAWPRG